MSQGIKVVTGVTQSKMPTIFELGDFNENDEFFE